MNTEHTQLNNQAKLFYENDGYSVAHSIKCIGNPEEGPVINPNDGEITIQLLDSLFVGNDSYWMVNITFKYVDYWSPLAEDVDFKVCTINTLIKNDGVQYVPVLTGVNNLPYICTVAVNCIGNAIWIKLYQNPNTPVSQTFDIAEIMIDATVYYKNATKL